jgi:hypothetical protein
MWLIFSKLQNNILVCSFVVGIFAGYSKPSDLNKYLENFVKEASQLHSFLCDTLAKSYIKQRVITVIVAVSDVCKVFGCKSWYFLKLMLCFVLMKILLK